MRETDVVIVGGGLAGSLAAAMLGRAGIDAIVVDPHPAYPPDFRCEKLDGTQWRTLERTGLAEAVRRVSTADGQFWEARFGRIIDKRPGDQHGLLYDTLVNAIRGEIPARTPVIQARATGIATGPERQVLTLADGDAVTARLVVLATGLNIGLLPKLGMTHRVVSPGHSISIGFDAVPADPPAFPFPALTYFTERPDDRMAYITLFPIGATMRANLFGYRDLHDPWLKQLREAPQETLYAMWPRLRPLMGSFTVPDFVKIRPVDLYVTEGHRQAGVVLVGDAFATSCPAAGTGARKVLVDVERLCNVHIPRWLGTPGMGADKIAAFYDDPVKTACDAYSRRKAYQLRSMSTSRSPLWAALRLASFLKAWGKSRLRRIGALRPMRPQPQPNKAH